MAWLALSVALTGCHKSDAAPAQNDAGGPDAAGETGASVLERSEGGSLLGYPDAAAPDRLAWQELLRAQRFTEASHAIDALPDAARQRPWVRYAAAFARARAKDPARCVSALAGLEAELPLMTETIFSRRAECQFAAGDPAAAFRYYATQNTVAARILAARTAEANHDLESAERFASLVVNAPKKTRQEEAEARDLRRRATTGASAISDARWILTNAPDLAYAKSSLAALPLAGLSDDELATRARVLTDAGMSDAALVTLYQLDKTNPPTHVAACERRADVLYKSRVHYPEAAAAYLACAGSNTAANKPAEARKDRFLAARSLSRGNRDDEAIVAFNAIAHNNPKAREGEESHFLAARLTLMHGRFHEARIAFERYQTTYKKGVFAKESRTFLALAQLFDKEPKLARDAFEEASGEGDTQTQLRFGSLAAVAMDQASDPKLAKLRWREISRTAPLSYAGMMARARASLAGDTIAIQLASIGGAPPMLGKPRLPEPANELHAVGLDAEASVALRMRESVMLQASPDGKAETLCASYALLGDASRRFHVAQEIPNDLLRAEPDAHARWAWECALPEPERDAVTQFAKARKLDPALVYAVIRVESAYDSRALSAARAVGLMQLLPATAAKVAAKYKIPYAGPEDLYVPERNVEIGIAYLAELLAEMHGSVPLTIASYNAGPEAVVRWASQVGAVPLDVYVELIPFAETKAYVIAVMGFWARYAYLRGGVAGMPEVGLTLPAL